MELSQIHQQECKGIRDDIQSVQLPSGGLQTSKKVSDQSNSAKSTVLRRVILRKASSLYIVSRQYPHWYREPVRRILCCSKCVSDLLLRLIRGRRLAMFIESLLPPDKSCCLAVPPCAVNPSPCGDPAVQISCQRILPAHPHLLFPPSPPLSNPPQDEHKEHAKYHEDQEVIVEHAFALLRFWICVR